MISTIQDGEQFDLCNMSNVSYHVGLGSRQYITYIDTCIRGDPFQSHTSKRHVGFDRNATCPFQFHTDHTKLPTPTAGASATNEYVKVLKSNS